MRAEPIALDPEVCALLEKCGLPISDLQTGDGLAMFGLREAGRLVGAVGIEPHGRIGFLRSLAVEEASRSRGYGRTLVDSAESWATQQGMGTLYLLALGAGESFFARLGYKPVPRSAAPAAIARTAQFSRLCPAPAALMRKVLDASCASTSDSTHTG